MQTFLRFLIPALVAAVSAQALAQGDEEISATEVKDEKVPPPPAADRASTGSADDRSPIDGVVGHFGIGYFTSTEESTPVGMRYWLDRESAIDLGIDVAFNSGGGDAHRYGAEVGYVVAIAHYHYSVVFARFGLGFVYNDNNQIDPTTNYDPPASYDINGNFFLGAELFLGAFGFPNVSLQGGIGLEANYTVSKGSRFLIGTANGGLSVVGAGNLGFHIYL